MTYAGEAPLASALWEIGSQLGSQPLVLVLMVAQMPRRTPRLIILLPLFSRSLRLMAGGHRANLGGVGVGADWWHESRYSTQTSGEQVKWWEDGR
jgi:hypothetical protein